MTEILLLVLNLILAIGVFVFRKLLWPYVQARAKNVDISTATSLAKIAVAAAEQIYKTSKAGHQKKEYVVKYLAQMGVTLSDEELDALIEGTVYQLNSAKLEVADIISKEVQNA